MNIKKLMAAEAAFLSRYPGGFDDPEMETVKKKHRPEKMTSMADEYFAGHCFEDPEKFCKNLIKFISASSLVSVFEKPRFRDFILLLSPESREELVRAHYERLYGNQERGFTEYLDILGRGRLAKWTLMSAVPSYVRPHDEVFIKPTTVKNIIAVFELEGLVYRPSPSWDFYSRYRDVINKMKSHVAPSLSPTNTAFTGFLMMIMEEMNLGL